MATERGFFKPRGTVRGATMLLLSEHLGKRLRRWEFHETFVLAEVALAPPPRQNLLFSWHLPFNSLGRQQFNEALLRFGDALLNLQGPESASRCWEVET